MNLINGIEFYMRENQSSYSNSINEYKIIVPEKYDGKNNICTIVFNSKEKYFHWKDNG